MTKIGLDPKDFVILWCGGYNTWTDIDTLFGGMEWAMANDPNIKYLSVGASTYGTSHNNYERLLSMIQDSPHRNRFFMLGWRPWSELGDLYHESDVGVNIDALHYE